MELVLFLLLCTGSNIPTANFSHSQWFNCAEESKPHYLRVGLQKDAARPCLCASAALRLFSNFTIEPHPPSQKLFNQARLGARLNS